MIDELVSDINKALDNNAYFSALALALTLPDVCGKAEYPQSTVGKRYIEWYDEYVGQYEKCPCENTESTPMPYLSGEVIYSLRNCFLHQCTPNIVSDKIHEESNKVDKFSLIMDKKNQFDIYSDFSSVSTSFNNGVKIEEKRTYEVNIRRLCLILTLCAKGYYKYNKDKYDFIKFNIVTEVYHA